MKTITFNEYTDDTGDDVLIDLISVPVRRLKDYETRNKNVESGKSLCRRCGGTGNEFFFKYRKCYACKGTGVRAI